ncbi:MAG TPA: hypothetical protein VFI39_00510 [Gemmatimonadales bacterium]|nr:hypothetical protein [Gemmatimonadales bacterium]
MNDRIHGVALALLAAAPLAAQTPQLRPWPVITAPYVEGYGTTLAGERFSYRTASPLISHSLLVRNVDSTRYIEWRTAPVPDPDNGPFVTFEWMASMDVVDRGTAQHHFVLSIEGHPEFTVPSPLATEDWTIPGRDGATLSFHTLLVDWAGDVNGLMTLRAPASWTHPGAGLLMRMTGESAGSPSWYMTFTQPVAPMAQVSAEQALMRTPAGARQALRVGIWSLADSTSLRVDVNGSTRLRGTVSQGWNVYHVPIPQVIKPGDVQVTLASDWDSVRWDRLHLEPVVPRTIYLIPHAHLDIGYNVLQAEAGRRHQATYDEGMALARKTASYPVDARFHWNVEGLWPVEDYLTTRSAKARAAFLAAARRGDLSLNAFYANLMTGLSRPEELQEAVRYAATLRSRYHVPINSAITSDVPGFSWGVVPTLAQAGIRYLSSGPNYQPDLPGRGDRIGNLLLAWGDSAFYWMSPSGKDSLLVMVAGRGYSWFHGRRRGWPGLADDGGLIDYMDSLATDHYPWDIVQVRYTTGDNGGVDTVLPDAVRRWNRTYASPHVIIATLPMMFTAFERRYGPRLQRQSGDLTGYWEDGAGSTARETAESRMAAEQLTEAATLFAMRDPAAYDGPAFWQAWRQVLLYSEHTWGADRSISAPDDPFVQAQWAVKRGFADSAGHRAEALLDRAAAGPRASGVISALDIFNPTAAPRSAIAGLPAGTNVARDAVTDAAGGLVPSERLSNGSLAFLADSIPAFGARRFWFRQGWARPAGDAHAEGDSLWNAVIVARVDTVTGALASVRWRGHELVDRAHGGWNEYEYVTGRSSSTATGVTGVHIAVTEPGPLVAKLTVTSTAPGATSLTRTYTLGSAFDFLEMTTTIDKAPVRTKEGVHIGFPFLVPNGQVRLDIPWAIVRPDSDQLRGANRNVFTVDRWADVSNDSIGVTWATLDAPLVEVGGMNAEDWHHDDGTEGWLTHLPATQLLYSYVMNNYWHTNFKADQSGPVTFRYAVRPHGAWDPVAAERFGIERSQALIPAVADTTRPVLTPVVSSSDPAVIITSLTPAGRGTIVAKLFNPTDRDRPVTLRWRQSSGSVTVPARGVRSLTLATRRPLPRGAASIR